MREGIDFRPAPQIELDPGWQKLEAGLGKTLAALTP
jgi:hypothetical protein